MNWLETLLTPALVRAVGYTLLHSLWQGALVALALAGLLLLLVGALRRGAVQVVVGVVPQVTETAQSAGTGGRGGRGAASAGMYGRSGWRGRA